MFLFPISPLGEFRNSVAKLPGLVCIAEVVRSCRQSGEDPVLGQIRIQGSLPHTKGDIENSFELLTQIILKRPFSVFRRPL